MDTSPSIGPLTLVTVDIRLLHITQIDKARDAETQRNTITHTAVVAVANALQARSRKGTQITTQPNNSSNSTRHTNVQSLLTLAR